MLGRKTEMSGMKRRKGPPKMTQGVDQIEPESQKMTQRVNQMKPQGPRVTQEMSRVPHRIRNMRGTGTAQPCPHFASQNKPRELTAANQGPHRPARTTSQQPRNEHPSCPAEHTKTGFASTALVSGLTAADSLRHRAESFPSQQFGLRKQSLAGLNNQHLFLTI